MNVPLIVGNWKMNGLLHDATQLAERVAEAASLSENVVEVVICPPYPWLMPLRDTIGARPLGLGAQDCSAYASGAFTGEVAAAMLAESCRFVLVGHSERRTHHHETDELVEAKLKMALEAGLTPILCVGETIEQRERGAAEAVVQRQIRRGTEALSDAEVSQLVLAYEPVWAIGTGHTASSDDAEAMAAAVRATVGERPGVDSTTTRVLYGGSVSADSATELLGRPNVDGALVGGASLDPEAFSAIINHASARQQRG